MPLTRVNHFVPQLYLKHFASEQGLIRCYRTLVPRDSVKCWNKFHIAATGYHHHLYTRTVDGKAIDDIELWLNREFETPAALPLQRAIEGKRLSPADYLALSRFVASQILRTPAYFIKNFPKWQKEAEKEVSEAPNRVNKRLEEMLRDGSLLQPKRDDPMTQYFPLRVKRVPGIDDQHIAINTKIVVGRAMWIFTMKYLLTETMQRLANHRWTILESPPGLPWFTSDDPVVRLNYHAESKYDFEGGWGSDGTEILLPLSPKHLLYAQVERKPPQRGSMVPRQQAIFLRGVIAAHAHRMIYAHTEDSEIEHLRPRRIDQQAIILEQQNWKKWHSDQTKAEADLQV